MDDENQPEGSAQPTDEILEQGDIPTTPVEASPQQHHTKPEIPKKLEKQPEKIGSSKPKMITKLKSFWIECMRVLRVTKKPDKQEFITIVKISALGMAIMGTIGFTIHFIKELLF